MSTDDGTIATESSRDYFRDELEQRESHKLSCTFGANADEWMYVLERGENEEKEKKMSFTVSMHSKPASTLASTSQLSISRTTLASLCEGRTCIASSSVHIKRAEPLTPSQENCLKLASSPSPRERSSVRIRKVRAFVAFGILVLVTSTSLFLFLKYSKI